MTAQNPQFQPGSINQDDAIVILEQADLATRAAIPLSPGLRAMAAETGSRKLKRALLHMSDRLDAGEDLPAVIAALQPRLTPLMDTLVEQGTRIGRLDIVLHWAAEQARRARSLRWQLWSGIAYPLVLLNVSTVIGVFVLFGLAPMFGKIFDDFGTQLPDLTMFVMSIGRLGGRLSIWFWFVLIQLALGLVLLIGALFGDWLMAQRWSGMVPMLGPLFRMATLSDCCHLLAVFIELRLPLSTAIQLVARSTADVWLREAAGELAADLEQGMSPQSSAVIAKMPIAIAQLLQESASAETLAEALHALGDIYAIRVTNNARFIAAISEPFILILTTMGIGIIVVSMFTPLINLLRDLS